jgi:hypothetical protein
MMRRHLLYHLCALTANDGWLRNLDRLCARWGLFDGSRTVAIARGPGVHCDGRVVAEIEARTQGCSLPPTEYVLVDNCQRLREVASFRTLLDRARQQDSTGYCFYAHTKGNSTKDGEEGAAAWRNAMYHHLLGRVAECDELLGAGTPMVGTHKMVWQPPRTRQEQLEHRGVRPLLRRTPFPTRIEPRHQWMFAGTFFWFRLDRVFESPHWRDVRDDRYGAEAWPGQMFRHEEVRSMWQPFHERQALSPYRLEYYPEEFHE